jgi:hypothetical protein
MSRWGLLSSVSPQNGSSAVFEGILICGVWWRFCYDDDDDDDDDDDVVVVVVVVVVVGWESGHGDDRGGHRGGLLGNQPPGRGAHWAGKKCLVSLRVDIHTPLTSPM